MNCENQSIEYKQSWRDEYLKWICGFANVFYRAGFIEHWGRGIEEICKSFRNIGLAEPVYENLCNGIKILIPRNKCLSDKTASSLEIIALVRNNPRITTQEIADKLKLSRRTIRKQIAKLRNSGKLQHIGPNKGGHWEIVK